MEEKNAKKASSWCTVVKKPTEPSVIMCALK